MLVQLPVRLLAADHEPVSAQIENLSVSGAFVRTDWSGPPGACLEVEVLGNDPIGLHMERIVAHITRMTSNGMAIEWCDLAPQPVRLLLGPDRHRALRLVCSEEYRRDRIPVEAQPALAGAMAADGATTRAAG